MKIGTLILSGLLNNIRMGTTKYFYFLVTAQQSEKNTVRKRKKIRKNKTELNHSVHHDNESLVSLCSLT